jgi:hypothetical protein
MSTTATTDDFSIGDPGQEVIEALATELEKTARITQCEWTIQVNGKYFAVTTDWAWADGCFVMDRVHNHTDPGTRPSPAEMEAIINTIESVTHALAVIHAAIP